jgi:hypothetical protein
MRSVRLASGLLLTSLVLAACAVPTPSSPALTPSTMPVGVTAPPGVPATGMTGPSLTPSPSPPLSTPSAIDAPACDPRSLTAVAGRQGETGVVNISVGFTNHGTEPCSLPEVPAAVTLLPAKGNALALQSEPPLGDPAGRVLLRPGVENGGWLIAYWMNWCGKDPGQLDVRVAFTEGGTGVEALLVGPLVPRCDAPKAPSSIQIDSISPD